MTPIPVVHDVGHGEGPSGPKRRLTFLVQTLQEGSRLFLRREAASMTTSARDPSNAKRASMLLDVATPGASQVDLLVRPFRGEDRSGLGKQAYDLPLT